MSVGRFAPCGLFASKVPLFVKVSPPWRPLMEYPPSEMKVAPAWLVMFAPFSWMLP